MNELAREFAAQLWAMEPSALALLIATVSAFEQAAVDSVARAIAEKPELLERLAIRNGTLALNPSRSAGSAAQYAVRDGVAHIPIAGTMMKQVPCMLDLLGVQATSTEAVRAQIASAVENDAVTSIVLDIDSPGGTVDGAAALADDVRAVRGLKPIEAHVSDKAASAAYWVAAQTDKIVASPTAGIGSIGVYGVVADSSEAAAKAGVKVNVISSHELKGSGVPGAPVTDAQLADFRRNVDTLTGLFVDAVASGRGMSRSAARELATGQVWIGDEAKSKGLVDTVRTASSASAQPASYASTTAATAVSQENQMDPKEAAALAAENAQLKADMAKLKAKSDADAALAEARRIDGVKALVTKYADRVPPAASAKVEAFVASLSATEAESYLKDLPTLTRSAVAAANPAQVRTAAGIVSSITGFECGGEDGAKQVAGWLGMTPGELEAKANRYRNVHGRLSNGSYVMRDGSVMTAAEFDKQAA